MNDLEDLKEGMILEGVVTNVTRFGAFVDVGVHQDGLVHISQLANRFVRDPAGNYLEFKCFRNPEMLFASDGLDYP